MTSTSRNSSLIRFALLCVVALCATVMVACGGSSGTVGIATGSALFTSAPSAITIAAGPSGAASYNIGGGTPTYTAKSSNTGVAAVTITGDGNTLNISGVAAGSAQITVSDAKGASVTITVTVTAGTPAVPVALFTTAPSAVTVAVGATTAYTIGGGTPAYSASSSNASVAAVSLSGITLNINGVAAGAASVRVFDATGASVSVDVTVSQAASPVIDVLPNGATGNVGDVLQFVVSGGSPGYTVTVNNPSIATVAPAVVAASGGTFSATLANVGSTAVTIVDARGQTTTLTITVGQPLTSMRISPSVLLVAENLIAPIDLNIYGGTGPYRAFTSDQTVSLVSVAGSVLTVAVGPAGNRCINPVTPDGTYDVTITAVDSLGASATSIMIIKDNGAGLNLGCP